MTTLLDATFMVNQTKFTDEVMKAFLDDFTG